MNPIWWLLLDAPTDAEFAMYILRKRKVEGKPLRGSKTIRRMSKARSREASDVGMSVGARTKDGEPPTVRTFLVAEKLVLVD